MKTYRSRIKLEQRIKNYNKIRDKKEANGEMYYSWIIRTIADLYSKYYTNKWERWY